MQITTALKLAPLIQPYTWCEKDMLCRLSAYVSAGLYKFGSVVQLAPPIRAERENFATSTQPTRHLGIDQS